MAAIRAGLVLLGILAFFAFGLPLQWLVARVVPAASARIPLAFCRTVLRLIRVQLVVEGQPADGAPLLLAANHVSWIDIPALGAIAPFCFLAKSELGSWPLLASFARIQGTVFVDRKRRRTIPAANRAMAARMASGRPVLLFPEGTTSAGPHPGPFRSSHFAAARDLLARPDAPDLVLIQPIALSYSTPLAAWVGDDDLVRHLWRVLRAPPLRCRITFGSPRRFVAGDDRKVAARQAEAAVAGLLVATGRIGVAPSGGTASEMAARDHGAGAGVVAGSGAVV